MFRLFVPTSALGPAGQRGLGEREHDLDRLGSGHQVGVDQVSAATREAPILALAIAFLVGVILARR